jgi:hypothetical protein
LKIELVNLSEFGEQMPMMIVTDANHDYCEVEKLWRWLHKKGNRITKETAKSG